MTKDELAEEIERIGHDARVTAQHLEYYSPGLGRNKDAEDLADLLLKGQNLETIVSALRATLKEPTP